VTIRIQKEVLSMGMADFVPAVRRIETNRPDAYAFELTGRITAADIENLYGLLEGAYELHDRIDLLIRIVDYNGAEWLDVARKTRSEGRQHALVHVRRCAAVGEPNWTIYARALLVIATTVEIRHFASEEEEKAWSWIDALPVDDE
jgi:SpoIIAA-like